MIVEDEKDLCYLLAMVLKQSNVSSTCAYSIREARETLKKVHPSIIFLDNHLPDGSGSEFLSQVKLMFPTAKIIMITAHDSPAEIDKAFQKGADYFISKPFDSATIRKTLDLCIKSEDSMWAHV